MPDSASDEIQQLLAALDSQSVLFGPHDPRTIACANRLAIALWCAGDIDRAIGLLDQALDHLTATLGADHPLRVDVLGTLGEITFAQRHLEEACAIHREVAECRSRHSGSDHPDSLAAQGDLAVVLFELGQNQEADWLEQRAFESAQTHLGKTHPVTCVLAWNRALSYERRGDAESAAGIIISELAWLIAEEPCRLDNDQTAIRSLLAARLKEKHDTTIQ